jgi:hypothetical protein
VLVEGVSATIFETISSNLRVESVFLSTVMFLEIQQTSLTYLLIYGHRYAVVQTSLLSPLISANCTVRKMLILRFVPHIERHCRHHSYTNVRKLITVTCAKITKNQIVRVQSRELCTADLHMQLQAVTGAGMVENARRTEVFHLLALVMKQLTAMGRFLGVSPEPT